MSQVKLQLQRKIWPLLILALLVLQITGPNKIWMMLLTGLTGLFVLSYFWARSLLKRLDLIREMRFGWSHVGDPLQERFYLINKSIFPATWIVVWDHSNLAGYKASTVTSIGRNENRQWYKRGVCDRRGLYTIGPTSIQTGDPFGIFTASIEYPSTANMMVLPPIFKLPHIEVAPGGKIGEGRHVAKALTRTVSAAGVREYQPGDGLRYIHWPTTVRKGEFYVRTFDSTPSSDHWIFLDLNQDVHVGSGEQATEEHAIILAASLANRGLESGKAVGLAANSQDLSWLPPLLEESQKWRILRTLALADLGDRTLKHLLQKTRTSMRSNNSLIVITSDMSGEWLDPLILLTRRGVIPTVLLIDQPAFGGQGDIHAIEERLIELNVRYYRIGPDFLDKAEIRDAESERERWKGMYERSVPWRPIT